MKTIYKSNIKEGNVSLRFSSNQEAGTGSLSIDTAAFKTSKIKKEYGNLHLI